MPSAPADFQHLVGTSIDDGRYLFLRILGVGAFGVVVLAQDLHEADDSFVAIKCLNNDGLDARQRTFLRRELALHRRASSHPNVVTLRRIVQTPAVVYVVLDYVPSGDLFGMITEQHRYLGNDRLISSVFLQLLDAIDHCHRLGVYHRDLKPENILVASEGRSLLLADFGLATGEIDSHDFGCGSTFYMSPECRGGIFSRPNSYDTAKNDVWSLGVVLVNLTTGRNPWRQASSTDETFVAFLRDSNFLKTILPISDDANEVLKACFEIDPMRRASVWRLREMVKRVRTWTMDEDEIRTAGDHVRAVVENEFEKAAGSGKDVVQRIKERARKHEEETKGRAVPPSTPDLSPAPSVHAPLAPSPIDTSLLSPLPPTTPASTSSPALPPIPTPLTPLLSPNPALATIAVPDESDLVPVDLATPPSEPATVTAHSSQSSSKSARTLVHSSSASSDPPSKAANGKTSASSSFANLLDAALAPVVGLGLDLNLAPKQQQSSPALMEAEETQVGEDLGKGGKAGGATDCGSAVPDEVATRSAPAPAAVLAAMKIIVTSPKPDKRTGKTHGVGHGHGGGFKKVLTSLARW